MWRPISIGMDDFQSFVNSYLDRLAIARFVFWTNGSPGEVEWRKNNFGELELDRRVVVRTLQMNADEQVGAAGERVYRALQRRWTASAIDPWGVGSV